MSLLSKIWKDPVWSGVIGGGIVAAIGAVATTVQGGWTTLGGYLIRAWHWLGESSSSPNWLFLVLWLSLLVVVVALLAVGVAHLRQNQSGVSAWSYTHDTFLGVDWQWRFGKDSGKVYAIVALCPVCRCQLAPKYTYGAGIQLHCEFCARSVASFNEDFDDVCKRVELLVHRKLRTGDWKAVESSVAGGASR